MGDDIYGYRRVEQEQIAQVMRSKGYRVSIVDVYEVFVVVGTRGPGEEVQVFVSEEEPEYTSVTATHFEPWYCHVDNLLKELEEKLA